MKNDKTKLIIWATVALVIGVIIGAFLIGPMTITGDAKAVAAEKLSEANMEVVDAQIIADLLNDIENPAGKFGCSCGCAGYYVPCNKEDQDAHPGSTCLKCDCCPVAIK